MKFERQREQILQNLDESHAAYYQAEIFGGPSLHFHLRALEDAKKQNLRCFTENTYAILAAWGMHRMGRGGSKMCEFEKFAESLRPYLATMLRLRELAPESVTENDWNDLRKIFCGICCMRTKTSLVGNSKVLAHAIPNLVAPIDRQYTLRFLFGTGNITNNIDREWDKLRTIHEDFFYPIASTQAFCSRARKWSQNNKFRWDISPLKTVDNLMIGYIKKA